MTKYVDTNGLSQALQAFYDNGISPLEGDVSDLKTHMSVDFTFSSVAAMNAAIQAGTVPNGATIYVGGSSSSSGDNSGNTEGGGTGENTGGATLTLTANAVSGYDVGLDKVRVYSDANTYQDYTSYNNIGVTPGQKVVFFHDSTNDWYYNDTEGRTSLGTGECCYITVPSNATGSATLTITSGYLDNNYYELLNYYGDLGTGWIEECYPTLGDGLS